MFPHFPPIKKNCPLFVQIAQMGLILPRIPPPTPVLYSAITHPFRGYVRTQNTPKHTQNTPFSGLNLKVGNMNYRLGNLDPNWAKCLKSGKNFSRSGQNCIIMTFNWPAPPTTPFTPALLPTARVCPASRLCPLDIPVTVM